MSEQTLGASSPVPRPQRGPISSHHPSPCRSPVRTFWMRDSSPLSDCCPTFSPRPAPAAAPPRADSAHRHRWAQRAAGLTLTRHSHKCGLLSRKQSSQLAAEATACGAGAVLSPEASQAPILGSPHPITPLTGHRFSPPLPAVSSASSQPKPCRADRRVAPDGFSALCPHCSHVTSVRDKRGAGGPRAASHSRNTPTF